MKYTKVKYDRMADGKATWYENPQKQGEVDMEESHAVDMNAQFQTSHIMYIKKGDSVPDTYSSTPVNLASQPINEPGKIVPHQQNAEDVQDGLDRTYKKGKNFNKTAHDIADKKAEATGDEKPSKKENAKSKPAKDNEEAVKQP